MTIPMFKNLPCIKMDGESAKAGTHEVIDEVPEALFVNGRHAMTAMMSPTDLEDFVTGYLFTEQIIKGADEIESIRIEKNRISVITKNLFKVLGPKKTILSGCGGAASYIDTEKLPKITSDLSLSPELIRTMVREVLESELHKMTGGIHVVGLASAKGIITRSEDIGRHNALDRVIGYGLEKQDRFFTDVCYLFGPDLIGDGAQVPDCKHPGGRLTRRDHDACRHHRGTEPGCVSSALSEARR